MSESFEKFSNNFKNSLKGAASLALELSQTEINPEHLLYGLINQQGSVGAELLTSLKIKPEEIKKDIAKINQILAAPIDISQTMVKTPPKFSLPAKEVIQKAIKIAYINKHRYVGTEHLLAALIQINNPEIKKIWTDVKVSEKSLSDRVINVLKSASKLPDITETFKVIHDKQDGLGGVGGFGQKNFSALELFGTNLTDKKFQEKIDPVIGREEEISRIIQILSRRTKNNPILLGEPGVGKTAIIEGLAKKIINDEVPAALHNKKIYAIDLANTVAGTMYRGEFESRVKQIIDEAKNRPDVILFIDEIHNIVGAGSASGSMDAANILKPALARGEIHCIGATTFADYRKSIEGDAALERRFQAVKIYEPSGDDAKKILYGIKNYFERFHKVKINDAAIEAAVTLSQRYLPEKFLPDKAIDLIDEAAAAVRVSQKPSDLDRGIKLLNKKLAKLKQEKQDAIIEENFDLAIQLKKGAQELEQEINDRQADKKISDDHMIGEIGDADIAQIIAKITGIPAQELAVSEKKKIINLGKELSKKIIGQDQAVASVAEFIKRAKAGLTPANKPLASFIFVGPSGIGKTHTAKVLSQLLFGDDKSLIKIDMSEYSEKFNISKLIGAPAGYVGYKESGQLTEKIKHKPYAVVLFDEIEKANRDVFDLLLQVLEDGYLTDAVGTKINFQNTIIIMTSNIGSHHLKTEKTIGFGEDTVTQGSSAMEEKILEETKNYFKIEFLNRVDKIVYFHPLSQPDLEKIVKLELENLNDRAELKKIKLEFSPEVIKLVAKNSHHQTEGARAIKKTIQAMIEAPLAEMLLSDTIVAGDTVNISAKNGIININKA